MSDDAPSPKPVPDEPASDEPASDEPVRPLAHVARGAAIRAVLFGVALLAIELAFFGFGTIAMGRPPGGVDELAFWITVVLTAVTVGVIAAPLALVEALLARRPRSRAGDWAAGGLMGVLAVAGVFLASIQVAYTNAVLAHGSLEWGVEGVTVWFRELEHEREVLPMFVLLAVPFVPTTVARLRGLGLGRAVRLSLGWGALLAAPTFVWLLVALGDFQIRLAFVIGPLALGLCAGLPALLHLADVIDARVSERLARGDSSWPTP